MNEELKDIKGSFFSKIGLYRNFIQHSMQQSLFNTIYILCKKGYSVNVLKIYDGI